MNELQAGNGQDIPDARDRLLKAALGLFIDRGYASTSVREIVDAAGVTKPVLYYYFGNKEGIYRALLETVRVSFEEAMEEIAAFEGSIRNQLRQFYDRMFAGFEEHRDFARFAYGIYFGPPQGAPVQDLNYFFDRQLAMVSGLVAEGMANGELRHGSVEDVAWSIIGIFHTIIEEQICHTHPRVDREGLQRLLTLLFRGISEGGVQ